MKILRYWWLIAKRGARADRVLVTTPTLDNDLGFSRHLEHLAIERLTDKFAHADLADRIVHVLSL
jgi:hypothetical protein